MVSQKTNLYVRSLKAIKGGGIMNTGRYIFHEVVPRKVYCVAEVCSGYCFELLWFCDYGHYCYIEIHHRVIDHT